MQIGAGRLRFKPRFVLITVTLALCGCATVGPQSITAGRGIYNEVINRTEDEQTLNALVRLRYEETFGMLSVASVTAGLRFRTQARVEAGFGDSVDFAGNLVPLAAGVAYEENPTISYVPLNGEDFMRRMISPLSVEEWALLSKPVRRKDLLFALAVQRINELQNSYPGEGSPPPAFIQLVDLYGTLRKDSVLDLVQLPEPGNSKQFFWGIQDYKGKPESSVRTFLDLVQVPESKKSKKFFWGIHDYKGKSESSVRAFLDMLGIDAKLDGSPIVLPVREAIGRSNSEIHLQLRSPFDVLRVFGAGIELPPAHLESGIVNSTITEEPGRWRFITIRSSVGRPSNATVEIQFRDHWFYIDATDTQSKRAFAYLRTLIGIRLAAPAATQVAPVLTVPVN